MPDTNYDVVGIGNAIVDVISRESEDFIADLGLERGAMTLVDAERSAQIYSSMAPAIEASGGSAANTMAGVASFGGRAAYIGKVRDDQLGAVFRHDIAAVGVDYAVPAAAEGPPTARCLIVVTPDAARTMSTFLGISSYLHPDDIDVELVRSSSILFCEGYIWDIPITKEAIRKAIAANREAGRKVSFTLSDTFCVERHFEEWHDLLDGSIDILFGNEAELAVLTGEDDIDDAIAAVQGLCEVACLTRSAKGSVIVTPDDVIEIAPVAVSDVVDTTGAGDLYAAGFLYGLSIGAELAICGELASRAAAEVISHVGARPLVPLRELAADLVG